MSDSETASRRLAGMMSKYEPAIQRLARGARARLERRLPGARRLVYDNYNALVIAFSPTEKTSDCRLSLALYPRWVTLFFANGVRFKDPRKLLKGEGARYRHVVLESATDVDRPEIRAFVDQAVADRPEMSAAGVGAGLTIKSEVAKQRPRRVEKPRKAKSPNNSLGTK